MIEKATASDIPYILGMYKKALDELGYEYEESLLVNKIVTSFHLAPCFLLKKDDIVGFAGFTVNTYPHNGEKVMSEYMFYIEPEHRNTENLGAIVSAAQDFAKDNALHLRVEFTVIDDLKLKERVLRKHGFCIAGIIGVHKHG